MRKDLTVEDVELVIDDEFKALLPAHSDQEAADLKAKVERQGFFDGTIIYWPNDGTNIPLDGHQRLALWESLPDDTKIPPPQVEAVHLPDRESAKRWMFLHQSGRRNATPTFLSVLRGRLFQVEEKASKQGESNLRQNGANSPGRPAAPTKQAAKKVAAQTGVSRQTVERDGEFVKALDAIGSVNGKAKTDIESGTLKVSKADTIAIGKLPANRIGTALTNVRKGAKWNAGIEQTNGKSQKPAKAKREGCLVPEIAKAVGAVSRALAKAGERHGQGRHFKTVWDAIVDIKKACEAWEASCK